MKNLAWAGLPPRISQDQFSAFLNAHQNLMILEMIQCGDISDLSPLRELTKLSALVLAGPQGNIDALRAMKSLTFLGMPGETFEESPEKIAELRRSLPKALVVPAAPLCLGSGWILLLFPIAALIWIGKSRPWRRRTGQLRG
jgi:hypothetical protein